MQLLSWRGHRILGYAAKIRASVKVYTVERMLWPKNQNKQNIGKISSTTAQRWLNSNDLQ